MWYNQQCKPLKWKSHDSGQFLSEDVAPRFCFSFFVFSFLFLKECRDSWVVSQLQQLRPWERSTNYHYGCNKNWEAWKTWRLPAILPTQLKEKHSLWAAWVCERQCVSLSVLQGDQDLEVGEGHRYFNSSCGTYMTIAVIPTEAVE